MNLYAQIQKLFYELFDVAGFDENTKNEMVSDVLTVWATKTTTKISEILSAEERNKIDEIVKTTSTVNASLAQEQINELIDNLDENRRQKALEFGYIEAAKLAERMISKFNLKSTPEQKEEFAKRLSKIITPST